MHIYLGGTNGGFFTIESMLFCVSKLINRVVIRGQGWTEGFLRLVPLSPSLQPVFIYLVLFAFLVFLLK